MNLATYDRLESLTSVHVKLLNARFARDVSTEERNAKQFHQASHRECDDNNPLILSNENETSLISPLSS